MNEEELIEDVLKMKKGQGILSNGEDAAACRHIEQVIQELLKTHPAEEVLEVIEALRGNEHDNRI